MTWTGLHDACEHQDVHTVVRRSHRNSDEAVMVDDHGSTPLHVACWHNPSLEVVKALIGACPQVVSEQDVNGDTPLHIALSYPDAHPEVIKALMDVCPTVTSITNNEGLMALHQACRYCPTNERVIGLLLDAYPYAVRAHIKMGELASKKKTQPLSVARETDHFVQRKGMSAVELRYEALSVQIRDGSYPLHMAVMSGGSSNVVELLIKEAPDMLTTGNKHRETPLHVAVAHGAALDVVQALVYTDEGKRAIKMTDKRQHNLLLHVAALYGCSPEVAKLLLEEYPNAIEEEDINGKTPFELAMEHGKCNEDVLHLLKIASENAVE